jgi:hypothetical protein
MLQAKGITAQRHNSFFTTSSLNRAKDYVDNDVGGPIEDEIFLIFPCNGFKYAWSSTEYDMVITPFSILALILNANAKKKAVNLDYEAKLKLLKKIAIDKNGTVKPEVIDAVYRNYKPKQTDLETAMQIGNEIWIHGKYVAIRNIYSDLINQILV